MTRISRLLVFIAALFLSSLSALADTVNFDFSYSATDYSAQGVLTASTTSIAGQYLITGITGTANGSVITALLAPGTLAGNDNLLLYPASGPFYSGYVDLDGLSFSDAANMSYNIYLDVGYHITGFGANRLPLNVGVLSDFTITPAVAATPEPSSFALLGTGLLGIAGVIKRRFVA